MAQGIKDTARENLGCHIIDFLYDALMYEKIPKQYVLLLCLLICMHILKHNSYAELDLLRYCPSLLNRNVRKYGLCNAVIFSGFIFLYLFDELKKNIRGKKNSGLLRDSCYPRPLFLFKPCLSHQLETRSDASNHVLAGTRNLLVAWNVICFLMKLAYGRSHYYW